MHSTTSTNEELIRRDDEDDEMLQPDNVKLPFFPSMIDPNFVENEELNKNTSSSNELVLDVQIIVDGSLPTESSNLLSNTISPSSSVSCFTQHPHIPNFFITLTLPVTIISFAFCSITCSAPSDRDRQGWLFIPQYTTSTPVPSTSTPVPTI
jgi:hypothetical protein